MLVPPAAWAGGARAPALVPSPGAASASRLDQAAEAGPPRKRTGPEARQ